MLAHPLPVVSGQPAFMPVHAAAGSFDLNFSAEAIDVVLGERPGHTAANHRGAHVKAVHPAHRQAVMPEDRSGIVRVAVVILMFAHMAEVAVWGPTYAVVDAAPRATPMCPALLSLTIPR